MNHLQKSAGAFWANKSQEERNLAAYIKNFQFERNGYFILDSEDNGIKVFNRIITLKDTWAKIKNN